MANANHNESTQENEEFVDLNETGLENELYSGSEQGEEVESNPSDEDQSDIPEKFRGKSAAEIAKSYQNLEKELGRKSNDLGELRGKVDALIGLQRSQPQEQPVPQAEEREVSEDEFWENPTEAVRKMLEKHPNSQKVNQLEEKLTEQERQEKFQQFTKQHPDFQDIVQDDGFKQWVQETPVRQRLYQQADNHDYDAANELLSIYKQISGKNTQQNDEEEEVREMSDKASLQQAQVERSGNSKKKSKGKFFRRADLIELQMNDPNRYKSLLPEIRKAYQEGRVK